MSDAKQYNLQELITGMAAPGDDGAPSPISDDLRDLIKRGLHHVFLPDTLKPKAAESMQLAMEGIGGLPRLIQWADRNPSKFYNLYARMIGPTIAPVLPKPEEQTHVWPEWLSHRRLAYQEDAKYAEDVKANEGTGSPE
jgi:hypothetical protein